MIDGIVAIVGRPNVGKSTLFNRLTRSDAALVDDRPGVTRDRIYGTVWMDDDKSDGYMIIDTGGFETDDFKFQPFAENLVWRQTEAAIQESDLVVLLFDGKTGLHPHDRELIRFLEKINKPHMCVVNKIDGPEQSEAMWEFYELGNIDSLQKVSAAHNRGVADLKDEIRAQLRAVPDRGRYTDSEGATRIAIVGRPNAGKSSILNRITGQERALVSEIAGTTRDNVDTPLIYNKQKFLLIDTAGIRRKSKVSERLESMSVLRSIRAIDRADVVFLVMDALEGLTEQDARLADLTIQRHKPLVMVINKWDLFPNKTSKTAKEYTEAIYRNLKSMAFVPVTFVSALENQRVHQLPAFAQDLAARAGRRVETSKVNAALRAMVQEHTPALIKGKTKRVKFYYGTQVAVNPPSFVIKCNVVDELQESYLRYMANRFRAMLGFESVPIRIFLRPKTEERMRYSTGHDEMEDRAEAYEQPVFDDEGVDDDFVDEFEVEGGEDEGAEQA